jgi:hypothetical protein
MLFHSSSAVLNNAVAQLFAVRPPHLPVSLSLLLFVWDRKFRALPVASHCVFVSSYITTGHICHTLKGDTLPDAHTRHHVTSNIAFLSCKDRRWHQALSCAWRAGVVTRRQTKQNRTEQYATNVQKFQALSVICTYLQNSTPGTPSIIPQSLRSQ